MATPIAPRRGCAPLTPASGSIVGGGRGVKGPSRRPAQGRSTLRRRPGSSRVFVTCGGCGTDTHIRRAYCKRCFHPKAPSPCSPSPPPLNSTPAAAEAGEQPPTSPWVGGTAAAALGTWLLGRPSEPDCGEPPVGPPPTHTVCGAYPAADPLAGWSQFPCPPPTHCLSIGGKIPPCPSPKVAEKLPPQPAPPSETSTVTCGVNSLEQRRAQAPLAGTPSSRPCPRGGGPLQVNSPLPLPFPSQRQGPPRWEQLPTGCAGSLAGGDCGAAVSESFGGWGADEGEWTGAGGAPPLQEDLGDLIDWICG